eukprot:1188806-Prorocentrum_minimum.AAC.3
MPPRPLCTPLYCCSGRPRGGIQGVYRGFIGGLEGVWYLRGGELRLRTRGPCLHGGEGPLQLAAVLPGPALHLQQLPHHPRHQLQRQPKRLLAFLPAPLQPLQPPLSAPLCAHRTQTIK